MQDEHDGRKSAPYLYAVEGFRLADGKYAGARTATVISRRLSALVTALYVTVLVLRVVIGTTLPHQCFGDPDCCGCLNGIIRGDVADIVCNECEAVVRTVPPAELQRTLDEMELTLDVASAQCPHCGTTHLASGFSELIAFVCEQCGETVRLKDDPSIDQFSGTRRRIIKRIHALESLACAAVLFL